MRPLVPFAEREPLVVLHNESQILQLFLHAIEIAADSFQAHDGAAGVFSADSIAAPGQEAAKNLGGLPGIDARLMQFIVKVLQLASGELFDFGVC
jgi:hypothetical protein